MVFSLVFLLFGCVSDEIKGQDLTRISFTDDVSEELDDPDNDGMYDYLVITLHIKVFEPGSFGVLGSIGDGKVNANWGPEDLALGETEVQLEFSGGQISQYGVSGRYAIHIEGYSRDVQMDPITMDITTKNIYDCDTFEAPKGSLETFVYARGDSVYIEGNVMTVSVNQTYPQLTFSYTGTYPSTVSRSSILYESLIAFNDEDEDGKWDPNTDEKVYEGDLTTVDWELDLDVSVGYDIALHGIIQMRRLDTATVAGWAKITFRLSSGLLQKSGNVQKFDIDIELWQPLDADRIALMHTLVDETGEQTIGSGTGEEFGSDDPFILRMIGRSGKTHGIYSWGDYIQVGLLEPDSDSNATTWFDIRGEHAEIWFSYPISNEIQVIHHDPKVGMNPERPSRPDDRDFLDNNLWFMLLGTLLGILLIGVTIYTQVKRRGPGGGV
ncbi:MAG: hypothetical protein U9R75_02400 [Candidatus Thermoplasmatota archaeon]|nr:hypothetical protein [Candidatus Thermoplasmatota archaeon]